MLKTFDIGRWSVPGGVQQDRAREDQPAGGDPSQARQRPWCERCSACHPGSAAGQRTLQGRQEACGTRQRARRGGLLYPPADQPFVEDPYAPLRDPRAAWPDPPPDNLLSSLGIAQTHWSAGAGKTHRYEPRERSASKAFARKRVKVGTSMSSVDAAAGPMEPENSSIQSANRRSVERLNSKRSATTSPLSFRAMLAGAFSGGGIS